MELCLEEGTVLAENLEKENLEMLYFSIQMLLLSCSRMKLFSSYFG